MSQHMTSKRNLFLLSFVSLLVVLAGLWWKSRPTTLCAHLSCIRMKDTSGFLVKDIYSNTEQTYRALYTQADRFIRIEAQRTTPGSAQEELDAAVTKVKAMYEKAPAPYPGEISDAIICDPRFIPTYEEIKQNDRRTALFIGYLNNRMTFGSCSQDQAVYRGILALTYCPKRSLLIRLELIAPTADFDSNENALTGQMRTLSCAE